MGAIYKDGVCYSAGGGGGGGASSADHVSLDDTNLAYEADDVQEAFEKVTKSLTYAEYQELTEEEKNNGTLYFITDVNGTGDKFQPVIYSEEEREIGVWTNGKPIYEKTLKVGTTSSTSEQYFETNILSADVDTYFIKESFIITGTGLVWTTGGSNDGFFHILFLSNATTNLRISSRVSSNAMYGDLYVTLRYTKTTDTAGSGTWTPQGVPAVHYSTEEQIVGTWVDGSTVYERDFYYTQASMPGSSSPITITSDLSEDIKDVIKIDIIGRLHYNSEDQDVWCTDGIVGRANLKSHTLQVWQTWTSAVTAYSNFAVSVVLRYTKSST